MYDPVTVSDLFDRNSTRDTRGHKYKITKKFCTNLSAHFFTNRVVNIWNNLPHQIVAAETLNSFKNALDKHWEQFMFAINLEYAMPGQLALRM